MLMQDKAFYKFVQKRKLMEASFTPQQWEKYISLLDEFDHYRRLSVPEKEIIIKSILGKPYLDLRCDWAFKHIMNDPEILMLLLNDFLPEKIVGVEHLPNEIDRLRPDDKNIIMDVLCRTDRGESIIVEMQRKKKTSFLNRMFYYGASMVHQQLKPKDTYKQLKPVYVICFMDFRLEHETDKLVYRYALREQETGELYGNQLSIYLCELERLNNNNLKDMDSVETWFYILRNICNFAGKPEEIGPKFAPVVRAAQTNQLPEEDQLNYMRAMVSEEERLDIGEAYFKDGYKAGVAENKEKWVAEGKAEGIAEVAKAMLAKGMALEAISEFTGLSSEAIQTI